MRPILVVTYWSFNDALIQSYTLPYVKRISEISNRKIYMICAEQEGLATSYEEQNEINRHLASFNISVLFLTYKNFSLKQAAYMGSQLLKVIYLVFRKNVEFIHSWCTPAGSIAYLISMLTGRKLILDSFEPHATAMLENGTWTRNSLAYRSLLFFEKKQVHRAAFHIAAASGMKEYALRNYSKVIPEEQYFVKPACIEFSDFYPRNKDDGLLKELGLEGKTVCVYAGKIGGMYLKKEIFEFFKTCYLYWGEDFRILMLTRESRENILKFLKQEAIPGHICISTFVDHSSVPAYLSLADFAINPVVPVPSKRYGTPIKDGEYWAMGLPVVITANISDDSEIIETNGIGYVLKELSESEYNRAVQTIDEMLRGDSDELKQKINHIAEKYRSFNIAEDIYKKIYGKQLSFER